MVTFYVYVYIACARIHFLEAALMLNKKPSLEYRIHAVAPHN